MPKRKRGIDLNQYSKTRRWELEKGLRNLQGFHDSNLRIRFGETNAENDSSSASSDDVELGETQENYPAPNENAACSEEHLSDIEANRTSPPNICKEHIGADRDESSTDDESNEAESTNNSEEGRNEEFFDARDDDDDNGDFGANNRNENGSDNEIESDIEPDIEDDHGDLPRGRDERDRIIEDIDLPLYDGSPITVAESLLSILTFMLTYSLSGKCIGDLLQLISLHFIPTRRFRNTLYKFLQYFRDIKSPLIRHYYCSLCLATLENNDVKCDCGTSAPNSYFIEIPIADQLQNLFLIPGFIDHLNHRFQPRDKQPEDICDVHDGRLYKMHSATNGFLRDPNNISFMWYTDGAPVFKSRKYSIWPLCLAINELPYSERVKNENIIVAGLWFGPSDPNANIFLLPIYNAFQALYNGIQVRVPGFPELRIVKALLLCGTCDSPAKSDIFNHTRFNGFFGCLKCKSKGLNIRGENYGNTHIYPYEENLELRSKIEHENHAREATETGQPQFGVKSVSLITKMMPDAIRGCAIDIMHCVYLGVVKTLALLWLESSTRFEPFSLYACKNIVDSRLIKIKPLASTPRNPRTLTEHSKHWKASEWRTWFFYYSVPILRDLMKPEYLHHYLQLVLGVYILNCDKISPNMIQTADQLLTAFVLNIENLYGRRYMSFNVHLLRHLPDVVRDTGPLWVTSCFPFEDFNGKLLQFVHGTSHVGLQIYTSVAHSRIISSMLEHLDPLSRATTFCKILLRIGKRYTNARKIGDKIYAIGTIKYLQNIPENLEGILTQAEVLIPGMKVGTFARLKKNSNMIYALNYTRSTKFASFCISFKDEEQTKFGFVQSFLRLCRCENSCGIECEAQCYALINEQQTTSPFYVSPSLISENNVNRITVAYLSKIIIPDDHRRENLRLIKVENIEKVCFLIEIGDTKYIEQLVNNHHIE